MAQRLAERPLSNLVTLARLCQHDPGITSRQLDEVGLSRLFHLVRLMISWLHSSASHGNVSGLRVSRKTGHTGAVLGHEIDTEDIQPSSRQDRISGALMITLSSFLSG